MRPIRRFGPTNIISDRFSTTKTHEKLNHSSSRPSWSSSVDDDRRKLQRLVSTSNHQLSSEKENRRTTTTDVSSQSNGHKPEIIINTPSFQLVCDRRRTQPRHSSADETTSIASSASPSKSSLKNSNQIGSTSATRSRWNGYGRRSVSFADDKGLQLAEIRLIDLNLSDERTNGYSSSSMYNLPPALNFKQASGFIADFILPPSYRRLRALQLPDTSPPLASSQIVLESYTSTRWNVTGAIAVRNTNGQGKGGEKRVFVRYSNDQWSTSSDNDGEKMPPEVAASSEQGAIDRYSFTLPFPIRPQTGSRLEFKFGVRMPAGVGGVLSPITYWDDNKGSNYSFTFV